MRRNISFFILLGISISLIALGFSDNNPNRKNRTAKADAKKLIDAGLANSQNDFIGPVYNNPLSVINESFEGTFPPAGWTKINPDGGSGWNQQTNGTSPLPGWDDGVITVPPGGGSKVAYCTWITGGETSNDQWLVTPQLTNIGANDSLKFWLKNFNDGFFRDSIEVWISVSTPFISNFTTLVFRKNFPGVGSADTNWNEYKFKIGGLVPNGSNIYIAFREVVADNLNDGGALLLDLVSTTGVTTLNNDIAATSIDNPTGNLPFPGPTIAPKASFANIGSNNQTNVPVTFEIRNSVNTLVYTSNKTITSLNAGSSIQVKFDSTFNPISGIYNLKAISKLASDQNRSNDTIKSAINVMNVNYGGNGGYFFANSTSGASGSPSKPTFCWKDTSGSTSLVVNTVLSQALSRGSLDDGYWKIYLGGKKIRFYGSNIDTVRIGTNGIIGFREFDPGNGNWNPPTGGIPGGTVTNAFFPFWKDLDFSDNVQTATSRISYKIESDQLIVNYSRAPIYGGDAGNYVSFQAIMELSNSSSADSKLEVQFSDTASQRTGQTFVNAVNANTLSTHLIGFQNSAATVATTYRFRNTSVVVTDGPVFDNPPGPLAVKFGPNALHLGNGCGVTLNLTFRLEAIQVTKRDTVTVELRDTTSAHALVESYKGVYSIPSGSISVPLKFIENGRKYFIYVKHRNSITTSSAAGVLCSGNLMTYDFTTGLNKAYGSNMALVNGKASFFTGEVTGDICVDGNDISAIDNDVFNFVSGPYVITDLNFDGFVGSQDLAYADNNIFNFVCTVLP